MITFLDLVVCTLITWRITRLINTEHGPDNMIDTLRFKAGVQLNPDGEMFAKQGSFADLLICFGCLSVWVGVTVGCLYTASFTTGFALGLASAGAAYACEEIRKA